MADVINLRQARKQKARTAKAQQRAANRAKFGRTKAEKAGMDAEADRRRRSIDGAKVGEDN